VPAPDRAAGPPWDVLWHSDAVKERQAIEEAKDRVAIQHAADKLKAAGLQLKFPHQSAVKGKLGKGMRELRPRRGSCAWRPIYRQVDPCTSWFLLSVQKDRRREESAIDSAHRCLSCGGPTEQGKKRGGWRRPDLRGTRYTERQLRALHVLHMRGASINQLAKQTYEKVGYKTHGSAASAISREWKHLGLRARDRIEQTILSSTKHGRERRRQSRAEQNAYRRWLRDQRGWRAIQGPGQLRCKGTKRQHPRKGEPCRRPAMEGSDYCQSHEPSRELERQAHLAAVRRRQPRRQMVPMAPFAAWLRRRRVELGTWSAVAESVARNLSLITSYAQGLDASNQPKAEIGRETVEELLWADGTTSFEELYGEHLAEAIAA
jgi:hypothetical protein